MQDVKEMILFDNDKYHVVPIWDKEAKVYISKTNIDGLVIEAETLEEFKELSLALGPVMIASNHQHKT